MKSLEPGTFSQFKNVNSLYFLEFQSKELHIRRRPPRPSFLQGVDGQISGQGIGDTSSAS